VINPNETAKSWKTHRRDAAALIGTRVAGYPLHLSLIPVTDWIDPEELSAAVVAVIQVDPQTPASIKRFQKLAASTETPLIAAAYDPPLTLVRSLVRAGAHDVVPLPLDLVDLETSVAPVRDERARKANVASANSAKLVSVIKSVGGVGATVLLSQLAIRFAESGQRRAQHQRLAVLHLHRRLHPQARQGLQPVRVRDPGHRGHEQDRCGRQDEHGDGDREAALTAPGRPGPAHGRYE
jgi:pilus assembly protein CpaE